MKRNSLQRRQAERGKKNKRNEMIVALSRGGGGGRGVSQRVAASQVGVGFRARPAKLHSV